MDYLEARKILALCTRFHCLPSALYEEQSDLWYLLELEELGGDDVGQQG